MSSTICCLRSTATHSSLTAVPFGQESTLYGMEKSDAPCAAFPSRELESHVLRGLLSTQESGESEFTPSLEDIERAFGVLEPTEVVWHQDQTGRIPNTCPQETTRGQFSSNRDHRHGGQMKNGSIGKTTNKGDDNIEIEHSRRRWWDEHGGEATESLYWQLYKSLAAFRMAQRKEASDGFRYDWVVRTRFDLAWFRPFPSLRSFGRDAVWLGSDFW